MLLLSPHIEDRAQKQATSAAERKPRRTVNLPLVHALFLLLYVPFLNVPLSLKYVISSLLLLKAQRIKLHVEIVWAWKQSTKNRNCSWDDIIKVHCYDWVITKCFARLAWDVFVVSHQISGNEIRNIKLGQQEDKNLTHKGLVKHLTILEPKPALEALFLIQTSTKWQVKTCTKEA